MNKENKNYLTPLDSDVKLSILVNEAPYLLEEGFFNRTSLIAHLMVYAEVSLGSIIDDFDILSRQVTSIINLVLEQVGFSKMNRNDLIATQKLLETKAGW